MIFTTALLLALAPAPDEMPPPPMAPWHAFGADPEWSLTMRDGSITFTAKGKKPRTVAAVEARPGSFGWSYKARGLTIDTAPLGCEMGEDRYPDSVMVTVGLRSYMGCGGEPLPAESLTGTSWEIIEIAGGKTGGANYAVDFEAGRFLAYDGCRRVDGEYAQSDGRLTMKPGGATEGNCGPVAAHCALRFWEILAEPAAMTFADRRHLAMERGGAVIRLQRPDEERLFEARKVTPCAPAAK